MGIEAQNSFLPSVLKDGAGFANVNRAMQIVVGEEAGGDRKMVERKVVPGLFGCGDCVNLEG